uniref:Uncharacterized protein n=1 Tax=Cacopsylla melanoneura TaxID=428564 RepID=A0A8D8R626_9HEMI
MKVIKTSRQKQIFIIVFSRRTNCAAGVNKIVAENETREIKTKQTKPNLKEIEGDVIKEVSILTEDTKSVVTYKLYKVKEKRTVNRTNILIEVQTKPQGKRRRRR